MLIILKDGTRFNSLIDPKSLVDASSMLKRGFARVFIACEGRSRAVVYFNIDLIDVPMTLELLEQRERHEQI